MKILFYGAGVIGSIYSAKLYKGGIDVTLLARGKRYESLKQNGVIVNDISRGEQVVSKIPLIQQLNPSDFYDLIIVTVRLDQLDSIKTSLKQNTSCPVIMFMLNNPDNTEQLKSEFFGKQIILGFPGTGGTYRNDQIDYVQVKEQKTTIGDIGGKISDLTNDIKRILEHAGFKVTLSTNMQAWLKAHAVFVACVAAAITKEKGDSVRLGKNKSSVQTMVKSINEGFRACERLGIPISPANLKTIFMVMPRWFSVWYWQRTMKGKTGTLAMAPHAIAAKQEMQLLAQKVLNIVHSSPVATTTLDNLLTEFIHSG